MAILDLLALGPDGLGLTEMSDRLSISKSSLHRMLSALLKAHYVVQSDDSSPHVLSPRVLILAHAHSSSSPLRGAALPYLIQLAERTGGCANLGILLDDTAMFVERIMPPTLNAVFGGAGRRIPLHCTATGKLLAAFADEAFIESALPASPRAFTAKTLTDLDEICRQLALIRGHAWASDHEEFRNGVSCVAAPIRDSTGDVIAALGVSFVNQPQPGDAQEKTVKVVMDAASSVSGLMGYY